MSVNNQITRLYRTENNFIFNVLCSGRVLKSVPDFPERKYFDGTVNLQIEKFWGKGLNHGGHVNNLGESVPDLLIMVHCNFVDSMHGFSQIEEMHSKFRIFRMYSPFTPKIRGLMGDQLQFP